MSFTHLSALVVALGAIALGALLFLLQRLRVRHRRVEVVTSLFWRQAVEESRARVLVRKFRHPWAFVLILVAALLVWLSIAEPRGETPRRVEHVLILDGAATSAREVGDDRESVLALGLAALRQDLERLPDDRRRVYLAGAQPELLLDHGEDPVLLERRVIGLAPDRAPASIESSIATLARGARGFESSRVVVYGDAPLDPLRLGHLPPSVEVLRRSLRGRDDVGVANAGVTGLGVSAPASGKPEVVDVLIALRGEAGTETSLSVSLDGERVDEVPVRAMGADGSEELVFRDLRARGGELLVELGNGGALAADDVVRRLLPRRERVGVQIVPSPDAVPAAVLAVLRADDDVELVTSSADVLVGSVSPTGAEVNARPRIVFDDGGDVAVRWQARDPDRARDVLASLGLERVDEVDGAAMQAFAVERAGAESPEEVRIDRAIIESRSDLTSTAAFPVLVGVVVRELARTFNWRSVVAAGEPLGEARRARDPTGKTLVTVGSPLVPPVAGRYTLLGEGDGAADEAVEVALLDRRTTDTKVAEIEGEEDLFRGHEAPPALLSWLLGAAAVLLAFEWFLFRRGQIP